MPYGQKSLINRHRGKKMYETGMEVLIGDELTYNIPSPPAHHVLKPRCEAIGWGVKSLASFRTGEQLAQVHLPRPFL